MIEKSISLGVIDPLEFYGINNSKLEIIKEMFQKDYIFDLRDILEYVYKKGIDIEQFYVYNALDILLNDDSQYLFDKFDRIGKMIYKGGYYIFQPQNIMDHNIPLYYRNKPLEQKKYRVSLVNNYHFQNMEDIRELRIAVEKNYK